MVNVDESWVHYSYPETKRVSEVWRHSIYKKNLKFSHSCLNRESYFDAVLESPNPTRRAQKVEGDHSDNSLIVK